MAFWNFFGVGETVTQKSSPSSALLRMQYIQLYILIGILNLNPESSGKDLLLSASFKEKFVTFGKVSTV